MENPASINLYELLTFIDIEPELLLNPQYESREHFYLALDVADLSSIRPHQLRSLKARHTTKPTLIFIMDRPANQYSILNLIDALQETEITGSLSKKTLQFYKVGW